MRIDNGILISQNATLKDALIKLNAHPATLTLFVVDEKEVVIGTITDGDIRRALLKDLTNTALVSEFSNSTFTYLEQGKYAPEVLQKIQEKGINIVPVLDATGRLVKVLNFKEIKTLLPIDAVIMAGGKGSRLMPLTENTPKPLLRIGDKPIIEYNIDHLKKYGIFNLYLSINYLGEQLENYFEDGSSKGLKIDYIKEDTPLGTIGAVSKITDFENEYVLVMNSDILTDIDYADLFHKMIQEEADMVVSTTTYDVKVPYGILETNGLEITNLVEKPTYTYHSNAGIYLIKKAHLDLIPKNTHFNATDLMLKLVEQGKKVVHFAIPGYWLDIGKHQDFEKAQEDIKHLKL